jgi:phosphatidylglycerophosphate synthase
MAAKSLFPLVRYLSAPVTGVLMKTPISANQVTVLSLFFGIAACWLFAVGDQKPALIGAVLFVVGYVLDNSDGEVARLKNQCSTFGMHFDTFVDWLVHSLFFVAIGIGYNALNGEVIWLWLGWIAAAGGTINYGLGLIFAVLDGKTDDTPADASDDHRPSGGLQTSIFIFRELTRADFCFLVLILATFDVLWVLLPAGAVGAQVYWLLLCFKSARRFHA